MTELPAKAQGKWRKVGKSALITGASSGLGRELAILFSQDGHVILSGRNEKGLQETRALCKDPNNTTTVCGDLRDIGVIQRLVHFSDLYAIRYLICCAGQYKLDSFMNHSQKIISDILNSNLVSTISLIRAVYPHLLDENSTIVHINSIAGKSVASSELVYAASKHGMKAFMQGLRYEVRPRGVRVLDVFPGAIQTPMCEGLPGYADMIIAKEAAKTIHTCATMPFASMQIDELHIGRFTPKN